MIYEASLSGVVRLIFWIIAISFVIRLIARLALPLVVNKAQESMKRQAEQFYRQQQEAARPRREGEVTVESTTRKPHQAPSGDYVDFVEIKE